MMIQTLEPDAFKSQMQDLRKFLAESINVHPGKILMTALKVSPIVVTYMMTEEQAGAFLRFLGTDNGKIATFRQRVEKIFTEGEEIIIGKYWKNHLVHYSAFLVLFLFSGIIQESLNICFFFRESNKRETLCPYPSPLSRQSSQ